MKSHAKSWFHSKELDTRRNRRALNRRIKPAWLRSGRCTCPWCLPWAEAEWGDNDRPFRALRLRSHALYLLDELGAFSPRLVGPLAECEEKLPFFEGIELEVGADQFDAARRHLRAMGYQIERVCRGDRVGLEADLLEPIVVWSRPGPPGKSGLGREDLEMMISELHGSRFLTDSCTLRC